MKVLIQLLTALMGSIGFAAFLNVRGYKVFVAGIGGMVGWGIYLLTEHYLGNPHMSAFLTSAIVTLIALVLAKICRCPETLFRIVMVIPLIPGASLYRTMHALLMGNNAVFRSQGKYTLLFAVSMSAGITLVSLLAHILKSHFKAEH